MRIIRHALLNSDKLFGIEIKFYGRFDKNLAVSGEFVTEPIWHFSSLYAWSGLVLHSCYQSQCAVCAQHEFSLQKAARKSLIDYRRTAGRAQKLHKFNLSSRMWEWIDSVPLQGLFSAFKCQKIGIFRLQSREQWQQITVWRIIKGTIETKVIKDMRKGHERLLEFNSFSSFELCQKIKRVQRSFSTMICLFSKANSLSSPLYQLLPGLPGITKPKLCFFDEVSTPLALYSKRKVHS